MHSNTQPGTGKTAFFTRGSSSDELCPILAGAAGKRSRDEWTCFRWLSFEWLSLKHATHGVAQFEKAQKHREATHGVAQFGSGSV